MPHSIQVVFACEDPNRLAEFWAAGLGYLVQPGGPPNQRVHIDVNSIGNSGSGLTDDQRRDRLAEERERLAKLGAVYKRKATGIAGEIWIEMFDPEGNWFCGQ
ncbi:MAG: VOC family protein [Acidimicrobiia bacterium]